MHRNALLLALAVLIAGASSAAADTRTATFAPVDPGVRASAMGGAFTALGGQPIALHWNPATLYFMRDRQLEAGYSSLYGLGLAQRTHITAALKRSLDVARFNGDRIVVRADRESGPAYALGLTSLSLDLEDEGYSELSVGLGAAWGYGDRLVVGLSLRGLFVSSDLDQVSASGYDLNLGLAYRLSRRERIAVSLPHLVNSVSWDFGSDERLPLGVTAGWAREWADGFITTADVEWREGEESPYRIAVGGEWWAFPERVALRGGFRRLAGSIENLEKPTFGAGVRFGPLTVDYAFRLGPDLLGDTHRIGLLTDF